LHACRSTLEDPTEWHIFSIIFLLAAGYTFKLGDHVKVDVFYAKFSEKNRALIDILGTIVFLFAFCGFVIWFSAGFVAASFSINEASADPGGLPARFLLKAFIPLGFIMLAMQGVAFLHDAVNRYKNAAKIEKDKV
jgi:TRAP-type mannitol/chloroaromatic compound transport system, small permease component